MADDKKRADFAIEMDDPKAGTSSSSFQSPPPPPAARMPAASSSSLSNNPIVPILSYCISSILMTVTNKYVLSGLDFNLNFFLLCVQVRTWPT